MSAPQARVEGEIHQALKAGDKTRLATLRLLLHAIKNQRIETGEEVDEATFLKLVRKAIKQRRDSAAQYRAGGREELADREESEAEILAAYLPPTADEAEIEAAVRAFVTERGLAGPGALGPVMREMMERFAGRADGAAVNRVARRVLAAATE